MNNRRFNSVNINGKQYNSWTEYDDKGNSITNVYGPSLETKGECQEVDNSLNRGDFYGVDEEFAKKFIRTQNIATFIGGVLGIFAMIGFVYAALRFMEFVVNM